MPRFELKTLTDYDDQSLINEIRRVAALVPDRFGSWYEVLKAAGLENRSKETWTREKIIERLQSLAQRTGHDSVTKEELAEDEGPSDKPIRRLFGTYRKALEAAGLSQNKGGVRYTDEECYENLLAVWTALGRQPNYAELKSPPSKVGPKAYSRLLLIG